MSKVQRVALIIVGLFALGFGIIWFILPDDLLHLQIGSADIEIYKRPAPLWLQITVLCAGVLLLALLACWWKYRKPN